jgi:hypothetical protein
MRLQPKILFLAILLFTGLPYSYGQENYRDFSDGQKETILYESFDAASNKWPIPQARFDNGMLVVSDRLNMDVPKTFISLPIDESRDFEIEISAASTSNILAGQIHWNGYSWTIGSGSSVYLNGTPLKYTSNKAEKNVLRKYSIRKAGPNFYYFIDEKIVGSTACIRSEIAGKLKIGFSGKIDINSLRVCYLLKEELASVQSTGEDPGRTGNAADNRYPAKTQIKPGGKFYGLFIGVSRYDNPKLYLERPEKDARQIRDVIVSRYSFGDSTTFLLLNPTRQKIIAELYRLRKVIGPNDNLLIFYAGHGYWDEDAKQGYWWAKDAARDDPSTWLSNSDLREQIRSIKSAHTLLISDACFSGGIFRTRSGNELQDATMDIQLLYRMPSRRAITSGTMTAVPDNSVFLQYFSKRLAENQSRFISSQQLFDSFRTAVINNSSVVPQDGVIAETGDEGGDFIFILRDR